MEIKSNLNYYSKTSKDNTQFQGSVRKVSNNVVSLIYDKKDVLKLLLGIKRQTPKEIRTDMFVTRQNEIFLLPTKNSESAGMPGKFNPEEKIETVKKSINEYLKQFKDVKGRFSK